MVVSLTGNQTLEFSALSKKGILRNSSFCRFAFLVSAGNSKSNAGNALAYQLPFEPEKQHAPPLNNPKSDTPIPLRQVIRLASSVLRRIKEKQTQKEKHKFIELNIDC